MDIFKKYLLLFIFPFLFIFSYSQGHNYSVELKLGAPVSLSGYSFKTFWCPSLDIEISGSKLLKNNFRTGLNFDYSLFHCRWIHQLKSSVNIINPNFSLGYSISAGKYGVHPDLSFGYSWVVLTNPLTPSKYLEPYNKSGFSIKPGISVTYTLKNNFFIGLSGSYKLIFSPFGNDKIILAEGIQESDRTAFMSACIIIEKHF